SRQDERAIGWIPDRDRPVAQESREATSRPSLVGCCDHRAIGAAARSDSQVAREFSPIVEAPVPDEDLARPEAVWLGIRFGLRGRMEGAVPDNEAVSGMESPAIGCIGNE